MFRAGDPADAIYFLLGARAGGEALHVDPLVQIEFKPPSGKRSLRFERIVHGEVFGELELLEQGLQTEGREAHHVGLRADASQRSCRCR